MKTGWTRRQFLKTAGATAVGFGLRPVRAALASTPTRSLPRIVFFTDVHARTEWDTPTALRMAADVINAQKPDIVIAGGDLITEGFESSGEKVRPRWEAYLENLHRRIEAPVQAAIGNHDLVAAAPSDGSPPASDPREPFLRLMELRRTWRSLDFGGAHFVFLDAIRVGGGEFEYEGWVDDGQLNWLAADLQATPPDVPIIVVTHIPLLTAFYQATKGGTAGAPANRIVQNAPAVLDILARRPVAAVLQGHLHVNEWLRWKDTTFITGGAVCGKWWRGEWHGTREGLGVVTLEGQHVEWRYIEYGWVAKRPANA